MSDITTVEKMQSALAAVSVLLGEHPNLPTVPTVVISTYGANLSWRLYSYGENGDAEVKASAAALVREFGGKWEKKPDYLDDTMLDLTTEVDGIKLRITVSRNAVCERVVVRKEKVTIPAAPARKARTEVREIVEWRCEPILAGADA